MLQRLVRLLPWLVVAWLVALVLVRYEVTREVLEGLLPQAWLYTQGLGLAFLLLVAAMGLGFPLVRRLVHVEGRPETPIFAAALGLGAISLLTLLAGVLGGLYPALAWAILGGGVVLALFQFKGWQAWARSVTWQEVVGSRPRLTLFTSLLALVVTVCILYAVTANGFTPPLWWDEAAYHLALPKLYAGEHRIVNVPFILYSNQPFNTEMLLTLALLLGSEVMASLVSLVFALLLSAGLWLFAREAFGRRAASLAIVLFWTTPAVFRLSGSTLIEVPLAAYTFLSVWAFWRWNTDRDEGQGWLILAALLGGVAAGTKLTGALVVIILASLLIWYGWRQRQAARAIAGQVILLGGVAFLLALPWYLKSYLYTGNPVWPFLNSWFGGEYWDALGDEYHHAYLAKTNLAANLGSFLTAPWRFTVDPVEFGAFPLGLLAVGLAPVALALRPHRGKPTLFLAAVAGLYYVGWFLMTHQTRFLVPVLPALCILGGYALHRLLSVDRRAFQPILQALVAGIVLVQIPGIVPDATKWWVERLPYLVGDESREKFLSGYDDATAAYIWTNKNLPADARVLLMPYENRGYFLDRDYLWANPIGQRILKLEQFENGEALWRDLRARGITHLLDNPKLVIDDIPHWPQIETLLEELKAEYAQPIFERRGVVVYELH